MTLFWIIGGAFIAVALLFLLPPLLKNRNAAKAVSGVARDTTNIDVYRDQLAELESDLRSGVLDQAQYESGKQELQQRLLQDVDRRTEGGGLRTEGGKISAVLVGVAVPLIAVLLYMQLGNPKGLSPELVTESAQQQITPEQIEAMVVKLVERLKKTPDDAEGWAMLGRSYVVMERYADAVKAYDKAVTIVPDSPEWLVDYADVLAVTNGRSMAGKPTELLERALRIDPSNPKSLALAGTMEFERRNFAKAAEYWEKLLAIIPPGDEVAETINQGIAEAKFRAAALSGAKDAGKGGTKGGAGVAANANKAQSQTRAQGPEKPAAATTGATGSVAGSVTLSPALAAKVAPGDTLFIFARAKEGPKMPLAIVRLTAANLPATFKFDDSNAMSPAMKLSAFSEVVIGARISKSGQAMPQSGDLQGASAAVKLGASNIKIVIDQQVP